MVSIDLRAIGDGTCTAARASCARERLEIGGNYALVRRTHRRHTMPHLCRGVLWNLKFNRRFVDVLVLGSTNSICTLCGAGGGPRRMSGVPLASAPVPRRTIHGDPNVAHARRHDQRTRFDTGPMRVFNAQRDLRTPREASGSVSVWARTVLAHAPRPSIRTPAVRTHSFVAWSSCGASCPVA
jgi:hypothetical protein